MEQTRFIVRARHEGSTLTDFLATLQASPHLTVVDTIGPAGRPHTAVVAVDATEAGAFEQRFQSPHLIIERDRPLSLFDQAVGQTADFLHRPERKTHA